MTLIRLNKYISESGIASRRNAEEFILQGRISVNDKIIIELSCKVDPDSDLVCLDGEKISPQKHVYFLLNKPRGVITSTNDDKNRRTVVDLIKSNKKVFPVGRLDYNTTGVLFITNDGEFSNLLTHPRNNVPREYEVKLDNPLLEHDKIKLVKGIYIKRKKGKFEKIEFPNKSERKSINVTCFEGRNHFVKLMFGSLNYRVTSLNRKSFAGIHADIPVGTYRNLSETEILKILKIYGR